jgi:hypothetical protein
VRSQHIIVYQHESLTCVDGRFDDRLKAIAECFGILIDGDHAVDWKDIPRSLSGHRTVSLSTRWLSVHNMDTVSGYSTFPLATPPCRVGPRSNSPHGHRRFRIISLGASLGYFAYSRRSWRDDFRGSNAVDGPDGDQKSTPSSLIKRQLHIANATSWLG